MPKSLSSLILILLLSSTGIATTNNSYKFVESTLLKQSCWQSSAFMTLGQTDVLIVSKKWTTTQTSSGLEFKEITNLSLEKEGWVSAFIASSSQPSLSDFTNFPFQGEFTYNVNRLGHVIATADVGFKLKVLIFPSSCESKRLAPYYGDIGVGQTPFGFVKPVVPYAGPQAQNYIHHRLSSEVLVLLDQSFPDEYQSVVKAALKKWNDVVGWEVYKLSSDRRKLDSSECLATNSLCFFWEGPVQVGWIGWGGIAGMIFDPQSGAILGATIVLQNLASKPLVATPQSLYERFTKKFSIEAVAQMLLRKGQFKKYYHPYPERVVEHLVLHEMGHALGLRHDFSASLAGTPSRPSKSVMEYMPFPVTHHLDYIGDRDIERLDAVYRGKRPKSIRKVCSDAEASAGNNPFCLQNDLGDPSKWYLTLADNGDKGVFTTVRENQSGLLERPYLNILEKFISNDLVSSNHSQKVRTYLCRQDNFSEIADYISQSANKDLDCSQVE